MKATKEQTVRKYQAVALFEGADTMTTLTDVTIRRRYRVVRFRTSAGLRYELHLFHDDALIQVEDILPERVETVIAHLKEKADKGLTAEDKAVFLQQPPRTAKVQRVVAKMTPSEFQHLLWFRYYGNVAKTLFDWTGVKPILDDRNMIRGYEPIPG